MINIFNINKSNFYETFHNFLLIKKMAMFVSLDGFVFSIFLIKLGQCC